MSRKWHVVIRAHDPSAGFKGEEPRRGFWAIRHVEAMSAPEAGKEAERVVQFEASRHDVVQTEWKSNPVVEAREVEAVSVCDCSERPKLGLAFFEESEGPTRYFVRSHDE